MDYSNKILVAAGCSHTFGEYLGDADPQTCHERSWVKKLEKIAGFKSSINLAHPAASNKRSVRVLTEFLLNNINDISNYVFMLGMTDLSRTELASVISLSISKDRFDKEPYFINSMTTQLTDMDIPQLNEFLKIYFGLFSVDAYDIKMINQELYRFHVFLNHYKVEHYFPVMMGPRKNCQYKIGDVTLPYIRFDDKDAIMRGKELGFKMGVNVDPKSACYHFGDDGHEFIAKEIYKFMTEDKPNV
jgi:hypothetical protein